MNIKYIIKQQRYTLKNIYKTWPHETLPGFNFIQPGEEEQLPSTSIHPSLRTVFSSKSPTSLTLLLGPKSNRRLDIILGSTPTTSCAQHLVFFWDQVRLWVEKKGHSNHENCFCWGCFGMEICCNQIPLFGGPIMWISMDLRSWFLGEISQNEDHLRDDYKLVN